jgi:hypothetical protein
MSTLSPEQVAQVLSFCNAHKSQLATLHDKHLFPITTDLSEQISQSSLFSTNINPVLQTEQSVLFVQVEHLVLHFLHVPLTVHGK